MKTPCIGVFFIIIAWFYKIIFYTYSDNYLLINTY